MLRWVATLGIAVLFGLNLFLPQTMIGRRGTETTLRSDLPSAVARVGQLLPDLTFRDLDGEPVHLADFRGHPTVITFERSVDW